MMMMMMRKKKNEDGIEIDDEKFKRKYKNKTTKTDM